MLWCNRWPHFDCSDQAHHSGNSDARLSALSKIETNSVTLHSSATAMRRIVGEARYLNPRSIADVTLRQACRDRELLLRHAVLLSQFAQATPEDFAFSLSSELGRTTG